MNPRPRRRLVALVLITASFPACAGNAEPSGSIDASSTTRERPNASTAEEVVEGYILNLANGDLDAANSLRCAGLQVGGDEKLDLQSRVQELRRELGGSLSAKSLRSVTIHGGTPAVEVHMNGSAEPFMVQIEDSQSGLRLCGQTLASSVEVRRALNATVQEPGNSDANLRDLVGVSPGMGYEGQEPSPAFLGPLDGDPTVVDAVFQEWVSGAGPNVGITAVQFESSDAAAGGQAVLEDLVVGNALKVIDPADTVARVSLHLGSPMTMVQPPDVGPYRVSATMRSGSILVAVAIGPLASPQEPTPLVRLLLALESRLAG